MEAINNIGIVNILVTVGAGALLVYSLFIKTKGGEKSNKNSNNTDVK